MLGESCRRLSLALLLFGLAIGSLFGVILGLLVLGLSLSLLDSSGGLVTTGAGDGWSPTMGGCSLNFTWLGTPDQV